MFTVIIYCILAVLAAGIAAKYFFDFMEDPLLKITWTEFTAGSVLCSIVLVPLTTWAGFSFARADRVSYNEYYSGFEKQAVEKVTKCERDGSCRYEYDCDPYQVPVTKTRTVFAGTDSKGNAQYRTETYVEIETRYHSCPYVDREHTFEITTTLGNTYTIGSHWFPENPDDHRWRSGKALPRVPSGKPEFWVKAKARIDSGNPGGVTKREKYKNYIQASQEDIYAKASNAIDGYKKAKLLTKVVSKTYSFYLADKAYFPSGTPDGKTDEAWQEGMMKLNGFVGDEKHGDLHLVMVDAVKVPNADEYTQALDAYWQSDIWERTRCPRTESPLSSGTKTVR